MRVSHTAVLLAGELGWDKKSCETLLHAAPMHDIGKIGIPDSVLLKPGKLDKDEWEIMKTHTAIGAKILEGDDSDLLKVAREIAVSHHERWDGTGYPSGLSGDEIPISGRIVSIADVFDALTSKRSYKEAWTAEDAYNLIAENSGLHFDPELVRIFQANIDGIMEIQKRFTE
jgi:putative two-component system response regulator